jgi:hypothetical protein
VGYVRKATIYRLIFEDEDLDGLEVRVRGMTTGQLLDLTRAASSLVGKVGGQVRVEDLAPSDMDSMDLLFSSLADALVEWNLEEEVDGAVLPVPATLAGIRSQESAFVFRLVSEWMEAAGGTPGPLGGRSTSGGTFPEVSLPMEPLSAGLPS